MPDANAEARTRIEQARRRGTIDLNLNGLGLTELPDELGQLTLLQTLNLSDNKLAALPPSVGRLTELRYLDVANNLLAELPDFVSRLVQLRYLILTGNMLAELPEWVGELNWLFILSPSDNRLETLPQSIGRLTNLKSLFLWKNKLTELPESFGQLEGLRNLQLNNNLLTRLPESFGQLASLQKLNLSNNRLTSLPESMRNLTSLRSLYLSGNDALGLPAEVLGSSPSDVSRKRGKTADPGAILGYYFRVRDGRRPLNEAKLILVGRGAVGKTSLVNRLVHDRFDAREAKTPGISITEWPLALGGGERVRLNVWDFGGQEIMHATHQFFFTQRSVYLLVLNGREGGEDADAEYWLKLIDSFGDESPVIMVLNKIREHPFDLNRLALRQKYPAIREFVKTDCADGTGIAELRKAVERETDRLEHLRDAFPASWFAIKDKLAGMSKLTGERKNYLRFDEYREVCQRHGEGDRAAQEALAGYLHTLGIALNYKDDPRLQDTHVLNPHWVTNGIYKILNAERLERQKGVISLSDLSAILDEAEYPRAMHRFLFDLMKKFGVCFSFPDDDSRYLVPELLDKQEPREAAGFRPAECLNFQYHYPVLPEGLLPRFIVRTHARSEGQPRWRTGVILQFEGCRALVKADVQDRRVFVSVSGPAPGRRRLLAVVRSYFEEIHHSIPRLHPQEMVPVPEHPEVVVPYEKLLVLERKGLRSLPEVAGGELVELDVQGLLNGVDLDGARGEGRAWGPRGEAARLFVSYSHKDDTLRKELETHLKLLQRQGLIETWHDRLVGAGDEWAERIDENLARADIVLLLVSADFLASDYCYDVELARALERHRAGEARVIPVIVRDVSWHGAPFARLLALPEDGRAVALWESRDSAWRNVAEKLRETVEAMRRKAAPPDRRDGEA